MTRLPRLALLLGLCSLSAPAAAEAGKITGQIVAPVPKHRANTVVFVRNAGLEPAPVTALMDQEGLVFKPRVLPVQKGSTVEFRNSDPVGHNVNSPDGKPYDLGTWPKGETRKRVFPETGAFRQLCSVHDDMIAWVVVVESKHFAVSDKTGAFELPGLPPGKYTLGVWHEKLVAADVQVEVPATGAATVTVELRPKAP
jgi:plastocyanin